MLPYPRYIYNIKTNELLDIGTEGIRPDAHARAAFATASLNELSRYVSRGGQPYTLITRKVKRNRSNSRSGANQTRFYCLKAASKITESKDLDVILSADEVPWPIWVGARKR